MLNAINEIQPEALIRWSRSLKFVPNENEPDEIQKEIDSLMQKTVSLINHFPEEDIRKDGWYAFKCVISPAFLDRYVKYDNRGLRVANYFECFIECADLYTKKRLIKGWGDETKELGAISIFEDGKCIGEIGEKSDFLWTTFFDYFVADWAEGYPQHTLLDHEELLSLQLWNVENKSEEELEEYVEKILIDVGISHGLKLRIVFPQKLWTIKGEAGRFRVDLTTKQYDPIPMLYLNYGLNCDDDRISYLHLYQVLEYFFVRAQNQSLKIDIAKESSTGIEQIADDRLCNILRKYTHSLNEANALRLVIGHSITAAWIKDYISASPERVTQYTEDHYGESKIVINLSANDEKMIARISDRIYFFRCAIAHAKGDSSGFIVSPSISKSVVADELPLLKAIAKKVIDHWS